jgi:hypothetical protein
MIPRLVVPGLFGLMTYLFFRQHSWRPVESIATVTAYLNAVAAAIMLASLASGKRLVLPRELVLPLGLLAGSLAISILFSPWPAATSRQMMLYVAVIFFGCATYLLYRDNRIPLGVFCAVIAIVHQPFVLEVMLWAKDADGVFYSQGNDVPNFLNVRHFGQMGFVAAMCGGALVVLTTRWFLSALLLTIGALFGVIAMGSRGAFLGWIVFICLMAVFSRHRLRVAVHAILAALISGGAVWVLHTSGVMETPNIFFRIQTQSGLGNLDSGRIVIWLASLREFLEHPLFGQGPDAYVRSGCCNRWVRQPHNWVLQVLMEFGIAGLCALAFLARRTISRLGGACSVAGLVCSSPANTVLGAMIGAYLAYGLLDGLFYWPMPLLHFALFCGLLGAGLHQSRAQVQATVPKGCVAPAMPSAGNVTS